MARSDTDKQDAAALLAEAEANTDGPVLTPEQTLAVFALVARQGFVAQNDLAVPFAAADREALEGAGLVTTVKREQNALWLQMTDAGWHWAGANLNKALPPAHTAMHHLLVRLDAHLSSAGENLRGLIGEPEIGAMDAELSH